MKKGTASSPLELFAVSRAQTALNCAAKSNSPDVLLAGVALSSRQIEVLQAVADADTIEAAARQLGISPSTINNHLNTMRRKLKLTTTCQMVAWGFRRGLLK